MSFFPPSTNHQYRGAKVSVWFLTLSAVLTLIPAAIHSFLPDGGAEVIGGLDLGDRRELVIGLFRWEGATQFALGFAVLAVALRYQALTPLFLALLIVERGLITLHGWVLGPQGGHHPPAHYASAITVVLAGIFLWLSLRPSGKQPAHDVEGTKP